MIKKAISISIAQTLFQLEEDAYNRLDAYLAGVRAHFEMTQGRDEIIADIESRIAEQLGESNEQVKSLATIEQVLMQMGSTEDFDDGESTNSAGSAVAGEGDATAPKRLYRDPDGRIIGGVAAGLAAYFGIEAVWMRVLFMIAIFFNGLGILVYIIFWIVTPEAKTRAQKLEMAGSPVNLGTISETVRERASDSDVRSGLVRVLGAPFKIIGAVLGVIFALVRPIVGVAVVLVSMLILAGVLVATGVLYTKELWVAPDLALASILSPAAQFFAYLGITIAFVVPLLFVLLLGLSLLRRKNIVTFTVGAGLLGTWFLGLIVAGFTLATAASNYQEYIERAPAYQEVSETLAVEGEFSAVALARGVSLEFAEGTTTELVARGKMREMERVKAHVEDGTLILERVAGEDRVWCILCHEETPRLTLYAPSISKVVLESGARAYSSAFPASESLSLELTSAHADITLDVDVLEVVANDGAHLELAGSAASASVELDNGSWMEAEDLTLGIAHVRASDGSTVWLGEITTLVAEALRGSRVTYQEALEASPTADRSSRVEGPPGEE